MTLTGALWFVASYVQPVTQHYESRTTSAIHTYRIKRKKWRRVPQLYQLSSEK